MCESGSTHAQQSCVSRGWSAAVPSVTKLGEFLARKNARNPFDVFYIPSPGRNLAQQELLYHPTLFKTAKCDKDGACRFGPQCAFYHTATQQEELIGANKLRAAWVRKHTSELRALPPKLRVGKFTVEELLVLAEVKPPRDHYRGCSTDTLQTLSYASCPPGNTNPNSLPPMSTGRSDAVDVVLQDFENVKLHIGDFFPPCALARNSQCTGYSSVFCLSCTCYICSECIKSSHSHLVGHICVPLHSALCANCSQSVASSVCLECTPYRLVCASCEKEDIPHKPSTGPTSVPGTHCFTPLSLVITCIASSTQHEELEHHQE
ncbi:hypothetical protein Pelo_315 [Pelomyxa schiedti]|nr:hypothetical protein Pelo_315 [Pelomyxa schiedti]